MAVKLSYLLADLIAIDPKNDQYITGLKLDSREVKTGDLFLAFKGLKQDGKHYISEALAKGASCVLIDEYPGSIATPVYFVPDLRNKSRALAARFYQYRGKNLHIIGITGTNGKTSCSHFIAVIWQQRNKSCGVIGTLGSGLVVQLEPSGLTTPD